MIELILLSVCFCKKFIGLIVVKRSSLIIYALLTNNKLLKVVRGLFNCRMLLDGWAIDFPERKLRFCVT
jgi:hypothetical protein